MGELKEINVNKRGHCYSDEITSIKDLDLERFLFSKDHVTIFSFTVLHRKRHTVKNP